jgi:hypothetical protein
MKKNLLIILLFTLTFSLSCGEKESSINPVENLVLDVKILNATTLHIEIDNFGHFIFIEFPTGTDISNIEIQFKLADGVTMLIPNKQTATFDFSHGGQDFVVKKGKNEITYSFKIKVGEESPKILTNLTYTNVGDITNGHLMGDIDGPAYCVYSYIGYNKASFEVDLSNIELNTIRSNDNYFINAYLFLGCGIYDPINGNWLNGIDAGLAFTGGSSGWHLFHSLFSVPEGYTGNKWYESNKKLDASHSYRLELDASVQNGTATLSVYDISDNNKLFDSVTFPMRYALKNGENIRFYQDYALDYPENVRKDTSGKTTNDWEEITLYNTNEGLYMKNVEISNVKIFNTKGEHEWTNEYTAERGIWPDKKNAKINYELNKIITIFDHTTQINLNLNR